MPLRESFSLRAGLRLLPVKRLQSIVRVTVDESQKWRSRDFSTFVTRPLSLGLLIAAALLVVIVALPAVKKTREEAFVED